MNASEIILKKSHEKYYQKTGKYLYSYQSPPDSIVLLCVLEFLDEQKFDFSMYEPKKPESTLL
jgi:hypothetical protein